MKPLFTAALLAAAALLTGAAAQPAAAQNGVITINFDTLATPPAGNVGPAQRVYQEYGTGSFTLIRIADPSDPSTLGNHFHTTVGSGSPGNTNTTAAEFFSDDGAPFLYFDGDYTGNSNSTYTPNFATEKLFSLVSFDVLSLDGSFMLTSSSGSTLTIDHAGLYNASTADLSGFQNIFSYRHDYTGTDDGYMVVDDIQIAPAPEPSSFMALGIGILSLGALVIKKRSWFA